jgi:phosphohistidine phosphatase
MILYLLRHARAEKLAVDGKDDVRKLTAKGRMEAFKRANKFRKKLVGVELILTSPAARAHETAAIFASVIKKPEALVSDDALLPLVRAEEVLKRLREYTRCEEILVVGHGPWLNDLASLLFTGTTQAQICLKKTGMIRLEVEMLAPRGAVITSLV